MALLTFLRGRHCASTTDSTAEVLSIANSSLGQHFYCSTFVAKKCSSMNHIDRRFLISKFRQCFLRILEALRASRAPPRFSLNFAAMRRFVIVRFCLLWSDDDPCTRGGRPRQRRWRLPGVRPRCRHLTRVSGSTTYISCTTVCTFNVSSTISSSMYVT